MMFEPRNFNEMAKGVKITTVMSSEMREELMLFAASKRWTMSQAVAYFVEQGLIKEFRKEQP